MAIPRHPLYRFRVAFKESRNAKCFSYFYFLFLAILLQKMIPASSNTGKRMAAKIPAFRFSPSIPDTIPTTVGPPEQPTSPPRANRANKAVPPFGKAAAALLKVPGHMMPTERPQRAQEIRLSWGRGSSEMPR